MDPIDYWRVGNLILGIATLIALLIDTERRLMALDRRELYFTLTLLLLLFATLLSTLAAIFEISPTGIRTALYTTAYVWCLIGLWITHDDP